MSRRGSFFHIAVSAAGLAFFIGGCSTRKPVEAVAKAEFAGQQADESSARERELALLRQELTMLQSRTSERGIVLTIPDVLFEVHKTNVKASAQRDLVAIAAYLKEHPDQKVLIEGHTDSTGTESYNHELSLRRGTVVETFFLRSGVDPERLQVRGLGEDHPIASNGTASGRQQNRRVELVMLNADGDKTVRTEERVNRYCR